MPERSEGISGGGLSQTPIPPPGAFLALLGKLRPPRVGGGEDGRYIWATDSQTHSILIFVFSERGGTTLPPCQSSHSNLRKIALPLPLGGRGIEGEGELVGQNAR